MPYVPFYDPLGWQLDPSTDTPITAEALNYIEAGVEAAMAAAEGAGGDITVDPVWAAKGDLVKGVANDSADVLPVGAQNEVLTVGAASALDWQKIVDAHIDAAAAIARSKLAVQTQRFPIHLHTARSSTLAGNSFWTVLAQTNYDMGHWSFVKDVDGKVYGHVLVPSHVAGTPTAKIVLSIAANATTGVTRLQVSTKDPADGETVNVSFTAETAQDITVPGTAYLRKDVTFTLTNAPAANDLLVVEVRHEGNHANDTLNANTLLLAAYLEINVA